VQYYIDVQGTGVRADRYGANNLKLVFGKGFDISRDRRYVVVGVTRASGEANHHQ